MGKEAELIGKLLKKMGLDQSVSGSYLPIANAENVELLRLLEQKQISVALLHEEMEDESSHCKTLSAHLIRKLSSKDASQKAIQAKASVIAGEDSFLKITENSSRYFNRECSRLMKEIEEKKNSNRISASHLTKRAKAVNKISEVIRLDKLVVENFKETMNETDTELEAMRKYMKLDKFVIQDCELKEKKWIRMLEVSKKNFETVLVETGLCEAQLKRVTGDFRRIHRERNEAVNVWKETINYIKKKDNGIREAAEEFLHNARKSRELDFAIQKRNSVIEANAAELKALEYSIWEADNILREYQEALNAKKLEMRMMATIMADTRYGISRHKEAVSQLVLKKIQIDQERAKTDKLIQKVEAEVESLKIRHPIVVQHKLSAEESLKAVYIMVEEEEYQVEAAKKALEKFRGYYMTKLNEANALKRDRISLNHRMSASRNWAKSKNKQIQDLVYQVERKKHALFKILLEKHRHWNRVESLQHNSNAFSEENAKQYFNKKYNLDKCRTERSQLLILQTMLQSQVGFIEQSKSTMLRQISTQESDKAILKNQVKNYSGDNKRITYRATQLLTQHQNLFIDDQMLKISFSRLKIQIQERRYKNHNLTSQRVLMQAVAKERKSEVEYHLKLLQIKRRELGTCASKLILQRREVFKDIEIKKKGYDIVTSTLTTTEDRVNGIRTEAHIILKHAQERELINKEVICWQRRIESAEAETVGLRNNLNLMIALNSSLKQNMAPVADDSVYDSKMRELKRVSQVHVIRKRKSMKYMIRLDRETDEMRFKISQLELTIMATEDSLQNKYRELSLIKLELTSQVLKIQRAKKVFEVEFKSLRTLSKNERRIIERDLKSKCMREKFRYALQKLDRAIGIHPKLKDAVKPMLSRSPILSYILIELETFGNFAPITTMGRPRRKSGFAIKYAKSLTFSLSNRDISSRQLTTVSVSEQVSSVGTATSWKKPKKVTTVDKLLRSMHATQSVVAAVVKKEEFKKLKDDYDYQKKEQEPSQNY